jgi:molybdenum cofactor synthesis domain-containing protein
MTRAAVLTISDGAFAGRREDLSGPVAASLVKEALGLDEVRMGLVPDEPSVIEETLLQWVDGDAFDLIVTSGGTGISPRDATPQATARVVDYEVPGIAEFMRAATAQKTPMAVLSRAVVGVRGRTLIINLPGSPKGVHECLEAILPVLPHALEQLASGGGHST